MSETVWWIGIGISAGLVLGGSSVIGLQVDAWLRRRERRAEHRAEREAWEHGRLLREHGRLRDELETYLRTCSALGITENDKPFRVQILDVRNRIEANRQELVKQIMEGASKQ